MLLYHLRDAAKGSFSILPDGPRRLCLHPSFSSGNQEGLLFVSWRYQFPPIYWANFSSFPSPSISCCLHGSLKDKRVIPRPIRSVPEVSLTTQIDETVSDPGSTAKFGMQLHLHSAPKKSGTRRAGHRLDLTRPLGINPSALPTH